MSVNRSPAVLGGRSGTEGRAQAGRGVKGLSGWAPFAAIRVFGFVMVAVCLGGLAALVTELHVRRRSRQT